MPISDTCYILKKQLDDLIEEYKVISDQIGQTLSGVDRLRLRRQADDMFQKIEALDAKVKLCESGAAESSFQQRYLLWEDHLPDIDYTEAFAVVQDVVDEFKHADGGAALFLLQNTSMLEGRWCVRRLRRQFKDMTADFKPYPVGPTPAGRMDAWTFLQRMGEYLECEAPATVSSTLDNVAIQEYVSRVHRKLKGALSMGSIVFLEIDADVTLASPSTFLTWFLDDFWRPLVQDLPQVRQTTPLVSVVAVITSKLSVQWDEERAGPFPCCTPDDFDACQFLNLPLRFWEEDEIRRWLFRFSGLTPQHVGHPNLADVIAGMSSAIYLAGENGKPNAVYRELMDRLKRVYETH